LGRDRHRGTAARLTTEATVRPLYERILVSVRESIVLRNVRDTLVPKLISGELRIPDAERIVSEAA
jgi:type I restriction enzyme, S subunit